VLPKSSVTQMSFARAGMLERPIQATAAATLRSAVFFMTSSVSGARGLHSASGDVPEALF